MSTAAAVEGATKLCDKTLVVGDEFCFWYLGRDVRPLFASYTFIACHGLRYTGSNQSASGVFEVASNRSVTFAGHRYNLIVIIDLQACGTVHVHVP